MDNKYLAREDAPFGVEIWSKIDEVVIQAAKAQLSARRLLDIEGPFGLALKSVPLADEVAESGNVKIFGSRILPVALLETTFELSERDLANYEETGLTLQTATIAQAAMAIAEQEDDIVFNGHKQLGITGLMNTDGAQTSKLQAWNEIGTAAENIITAVTKLDEAGYHGPYMLGLSPQRYNLLFRRYPQGFGTELEHIQTIIGTMPVKLPAVKKGGVLLQAGKQYASIVLGQDLAAGFVGPDDGAYIFKITESLTPRVRIPSAICLLNE